MRKICQHGDVQLAGPIAPSMQQGCPSERCAESSGGESHANAGQPCARGNKAPAGPGAAQGGLGGMGKGRVGLCWEFVELTYML